MVAAYAATGGAGKGGIVGHAIGVGATDFGTGTGGGTTTGFVQP
jgi:hypothetical protein